MRSIGSNNTKSRKYIATHVSTGVTVRFTGIRAFCKALWGTNLAGNPRYLSSAIEMCTGNSKQRNVKGWIFQYDNDDDPSTNPYDNDVLDPIGNYLYGKRTATT